MKTVRIFAAGALLALAAAAGAGTAQDSPHTKQPAATTGCPYLDSIHDNRTWSGSNECPAWGEQRSHRNAGVPI